MGIPMIHAGLKLDTPNDFVIDQAMISFRAPAPTTGDPRVLHKQTPIRPSLIVHRRDAGAESDIGILAGEITAELVTSVPGLSALTTESFSFVDGAPGILVGFDFGAPEVGTARQYHALRVDGPILTTLTLTIDKLTLNEPTKAKWLGVLASVVRDGDGEIK
jgi:hypothetical protein